MQICPYIKAGMFRRYRTKELLWIAYNLFVEWGSKLVDGKSFCTVVFGLPLQLVIVQIMLFCKYSCISVEV